jgi:hypothetical protein
MASEPSQYRTMLEKYQGILEMTQPEKDEAAD